MYSAQHFCRPVIAFVCIFIFITVVLPTAGAQDNMTVEDAIRIGLENNYEILIAENNAEIAKNNRGKGTANFLPVLDAGSTYRYDAHNESTGSPLSFGNTDSRSWSSDIRLSWTLFDGFRMFADNRRYEKLARYGTLDARDTIENTVVEIMRSFFYLVQQEQLLDVARETRNISRDRLDREEVRHTIGGASSTDLLNARVNFNKDQSALLDQQIVVTIARKNLSVLLARDPRTPLMVKKEITIPHVELSLPELIRQAHNQNSALLAARYSRAAAAEETKVAQSAFWPRIDLTGSYGYTDSALFGDDIMRGADRNSHAIDAGVGLVMSFNLFNGNVDTINLQNARLKELNEALRVKDLKNRIAGFVQETRTSFLKQMEKVSLEKQNLDTAYQNLQLQKQRYETGASDSLDFRDAQVNYAQARVRLIVSRYDARISLLEIQQLIGNISLN